MKYMYVYNQEKEKTKIYRSKMSYIYIYMDTDERTGSQSEKRETEEEEEKNEGILILILTSGFIVFIFDPLEAKRGSFLDLFDAIGGHSFGLPKPFSDLLLVLGTAAAAAALLVFVRDYLLGVAVIPLVRPIVGAVSCHGLILRNLRG